MIGHTIKNIEWITTIVGKINGKVGRGRPKTRFKIYKTSIKRIMKNNLQRIESKCGR